MALSSLFERENLKKKNSPTSDTTYYRQRVGTVFRNHPSLWCEYTVGRFRYTRRCEFYRSTNNYCLLCYYYCYQLIGRTTMQKNFTVRYNNIRDGCHRYSFNVSNFNNDNNCFSLSRRDFSDLKHFV